MMSCFFFLFPIIINALRAPPPVFFFSFSNDPHISRYHSPPTRPSRCPSAWALWRWWRV